MYWAPWVKLMMLISPISSCPNSAWVGIPKISVIVSPREAISLLHQRAPPFVQRPERLFRRNGRADLVVVVGALGLRRLLHLDKISGMKLSAVRAHRALAEQRIVRRQLLHLGDHLGTVVGLARLNCLEVMRDRRIHACLHHGRVFAAVGGGEASGECT